MPELSSSYKAASAERIPTPLPVTPVADERLLGAWCEWLGALATDAEAALATAIAYRELTPAGRDYWLTVLEQDAKRLDVPKIALYAPLLAVESDPARRMRISQAMGPAELSAQPRFAARGLSGVAGDRTRVAVLITPLYLDFAQVVACGFLPNTGFSWVRHDPIVLFSRVPQVGDRIEGVQLESAPLKPLIDDLAHAVLAQQRNGREIPEALRTFADLFGPLDGGSTPPPAP
ncbi:MAG TPA: hypothetical protein VGK73_37120 [Polyangiaceae bacterium]